MTQKVRLFTATPDPRWTITLDGFDPALELSAESVLSLVNGYAGVRGALEEGSAASNPQMFVAGVFNQPEAPQDDVLEQPIPELVVTPDWSRIQILVDGQPLNMELCQLISQRRVLDMRQGVLLREWRLRSIGGRVTALRSVRFASLANRHQFVQQIAVIAENYSAPMELVATVEGAVTNEHSTVHLLPTDVRVLNDGALLAMRTTEGKYTLAYAAHATMADTAGEQVEAALGLGQAAIEQRFRFTAQQGREYTMQKHVAVYTSRDGVEPAAAAAGELAAMLGQGMPALLAQHVAAWADHWRESDVEIADAEDVQREVRWAIYQLNGSAWAGDERSSVGARSLTGERYHGHVFWDTETFVWPFHCYTNPATARALLMYRYHTLDGARHKATEQGYKGALFAWESTDDGEETTPPWIRLPNGVRQQILTGEQEHHLASDIVYAVLQYRQATGDDAFFFRYGAEIVLEVARFWVRRAQQGADGRYHITMLIGPDEYHEHTSDGAYTNVMAWWALRRALETAEELQAREPERWAELAERLALTEAERELWQRVSSNMTVLFDPETGLFEQFAGYHELDEVDLRGYDSGRATMDLVLGWERLQRTKVLKQADVVMLLFLLWDEFALSVHEANFRYYEPRTAHDSSLSASFHALMAARLGDLAMAERYLRKATHIDLDFTRKGWAGANTGVHIAAQGGVWQALAFGFLGMRPSDEGVRFVPAIPARWGRVQLRLAYRGARLRVTGWPDGRAEIANEGGAAVQVAVGAAPWSSLAPGETLAA